MKINRYKNIILFFILTQLIVNTSSANQCLSVFEKETGRIELTSEISKKSFEEIEGKIQELNNLVTQTQTKETDKHEPYRKEILKSIKKIKKYIKKVKHKDRVKSIHIAKIESVSLALDIAIIFSKRKSEQEIDQAMDLFTVLLSTSFLKENILKEKEINFISVYHNFLSHIYGKINTQPESKTLRLILMAINDFTNSYPNFTKGKQFGHSKIKKIDIDFWLGHTSNILYAISRTD